MVLMVSSDNTGKHIVFCNPFAQICMYLSSLSSAAATQSLSCSSAAATQSLSCSSNASGGEVDGTSTNPPLAAEEQDSDCAAAAEEQDSDCAAAADDSDDKEMQFFVNRLQKTQCLQVLSDDTISTIEALVANKEDVSLSRLHFTSMTKSLETAAARSQTSKSQMKQRFRW